MLLVHTTTHHQKGRVQRSKTVVLQWIKMAYAAGCSIPNSWNQFQCRYSVCSRSPAPSHPSEIQPVCAKRLSWKSGPALCCAFSRQIDFVHSRSKQPLVKHWCAFLFPFADLLLFLSDWAVCVGSQMQTSTETVESLSLSPSCVFI